MAVKRLLPLLLLLAAGAAEAKTPYMVFPSDDLFKPLLADPRQIQLGAAYYRLRGDNVSDAALGHSWGMARWYSAQDAWAWQWDLEAMAFSRFQLTGGINEFQTVDFLANLPLEVRHGDASGKVMLFHQSSHLGDDYIRRVGSTGFRYSVEGLRATLSEDLGRHLRVYGGGTYLIHNIPDSLRRGVAQAGFELTSKDLQLSVNYPCHLYLAQDLESRESVRWNMDSSTTVGARLGFKDGQRTMRVYVGYFTGHSPYGQFFAEREHYASFGISLDL